MTSEKTILAYIIDQLQDIQEGKNWIGSSYASKLNDINDTNAFTRPLDGMHSVAEIISHLTLWRQEAILKIKTGTGSKTDDCEENWLSNKALKSKGWNTIKSEYDRTTLELVSLLKHRNDSFLDELYYDTDFRGEYPYRFVINGMLHHDIYHLGQIGIILKYLQSN